MSTVNNVVMANVVKDTGGARDTWPAIWAATRSMKKAGWKVLASTDGTTKTVSDDPGLDEFGSGTVTNAGASAASTGAISGGRMTVTGLTGVVAADKGRFLRLSSATSAGNNHHHQIEEIVSTTEVRVDARRTAFTPVASDASNGSIVWEILDPTTETRAAGLDTVEAWTVMSGPSTVKIPITSAPVDGSSGFTFIRGENISQATTGAEGEVLGFVFDADGSAGYLVVSPRVIGSGGDPFGWGTTNTMTGATSGATVDQVGTAVEYRQQIMIKKGSDRQNGIFYVQCIDPSGESSESFETLASSVGATATSAPGGGGTGNAFPTIAYVALGSGGSGTTETWLGQSSSPIFGNAQIIAADAIFEEGYSADGTWAACIAVTATTSGATGGVYGAVGVFRLDDTEPGDVDPWITLSGASAALYSTASRTTAVDTATAIYDTDYCSSGIQDLQSAATYTYWRGWRRRGLGSDDAYIGCEMAVQYLVQESEFVVEEKPTVLDEVASEPVTTIAREPVVVVCAGESTMLKMRKGTVRHLTLVQNGNPNRTYDGGKALCLHNLNGCFVITPWDETSVPRSV